MCFSCKSRTSWNASSCVDMFVFAVLFWTCLCCHFVVHFICVLMEHVFLSMVWHKPESSQMACSRGFPEYLTLQQQFYCCRIWSLRTYFFWFLLYSSRCNVLQWPYCSFSMGTWQLKEDDEEFGTTKRGYQDSATLWTAFCILLMGKQRIMSIRRNSL